MRKWENTAGPHSEVRSQGVRLLLEDLRQALDRGVKIRILTGNYLGITQPGALYLIKDKLGDQVDLRFYNEGRDRLPHHGLLPQAV